MKGKIIRDINDIDISTQEGKLLIAAIGLLANGNRTEVIEKLNGIVADAHFVMSRMSKNKNKG